MSRHSIKSLVAVPGSSFSKRSICAFARSKSEESCSMASANLREIAPNRRFFSLCVSGVACCRVGLFTDGRTPYRTVTCCLRLDECRRFSMSFRVSVVLSSMLWPIRNAAVDEVV